MVGGFFHTTDAQGNINGSYTVDGNAASYYVLPIGSINNGGGTHNGNVSGSDFIYDNNNSLGLAIGILEPGFGAAWDAVRAATNAYTNGAKIISKVGGAGLVVANAALTGYTIKKELDNGKFNTHSIVNGAVTATGVVLVGAGLVLSAPVIAVVGAGLGIGYGIAELAGFDDWIDTKTDNWGQNLIK